MTELPKTFDPAAIEARWYSHWEEGGLFTPARPGAEPFTIVMPPPNVTGSLHIGHALDITLQDILVRHARLKGRDARWVVGTDHAGIATQMVVERDLAGQGIVRQDMGREAFVEHVWEWKAESGGAITRQLRRLGASCDWASERFTMDEGFSKAVTHVFVELHRRGLLYRDKRLVNWDPKFQTAISDLEVETREVPGKFWHLRYPLADGSGDIMVATTRPETMLADMAVAVHPEDARYRDMVGKKVRLPITGRLIPIIADEHADPALGSGAVKITPGHDFNDFEVCLRAGIKPAEMLNMLDARACIAQPADGLVPAELIGLDRFEARQRIVALLEAAGALEKVEDRTIPTPYGDRSGVVIEPWLTDQWYIDAKTLAGPALDAVRSGAIRIVPKTWEKTYYNWLENIQPWCVSRQLWWGHRIPAWYGPDFLVKKSMQGDGAAYPVRRTKRRIFVAEESASAIEAARLHYDGAGHRQPNGSVFKITEVATWEDAQACLADGIIGICRDPDVLDTWFSSALWPFATLGWPEAAYDATPPFVLSEVEGRAATAAPEAHASTTLSTNGEGERVPQPESRFPQPVDRPPQLAGRYPNDILISGFDILFFWDARMIMQGLEFMGDVPFKTLYLHGLVRDAQGAKMSKSKGNTINPLGLIDRYGADALRFTMAAMESQGRDIRLDEKRVEGYRNFATKLWNAARFLQANGVGASAALEAPPAELPVNRWIIGEIVRTVQALDLALADLRFDEAANAIYHFVWDRFCDWYVELIKTEIGEETKAVAGWAFDQILAMLHPFMPFVTEELWAAMGERKHALIAARWPMADATRIDAEASAEVEWLIGCVQAIRAQRTDVGVSPSAVLPAALFSGNNLALTRLNKHKNALARMARVRPAEIVREDHGNFVFRRDRIVSDFTLADRVDRTSFTSLLIPVGGAELIVAADGIVDLVTQRARLAKSSAVAEKERDALAARLASEAFLAKARPEAVAKARADHAERAGEAERLRAALARLG